MGDETLLSKEALEVIRQIERDMQSEFATGLWSYYVDFLLANLYDSSILLCENGEEKLLHRNCKVEGLVGPTSDYFKDTNIRMNFARWFRPLLLIGLTACIYVCLIAMFQADPAICDALRMRLVLVNNIHHQVKETIPLLDEIALTWSFSWMLLSAVLAGIVQLVLSSVAWFKYSKPASVGCMIGAGIACGALFTSA
jgi:hypothetical protein